MMALRKASQSRQNASVADVVDESGGDKALVRIDVDPIVDPSPRWSTARYS